VRIIQRPGHIGRDAKRLVDRQSAVPRQAYSERIAGDIRHHEKQCASGFTGVVQRKHVRMLKPRDRLDLAKKTLGGERDAQFRIEHLDRDAPIVLHVVRGVDGRHSSTTNLALYDVALRERGLNRILERSHVVGPPRAC
jgi:hypothetical protein